MDGHHSVLIVEDDSNDVALLEAALRANHVPNPVHAVTGCQEAMDYLAGEGRFADRQAFPFPAMIFLDLRLPRQSGMELLQWVKSHQQCAVVPIIVFSASNWESDIRRAYQLGANCYLVKPHSFDELQQLIKTTFDFWRLCRTPALPQRRG